MNKIGRIANSRYLVWVLLALPGVLLLYGFARQWFYYGEVLHISGKLSAWLLVFALAITPLRLLFTGAGWIRWLLRRRRCLGVAAFAYGLLHAVVYVDRQASAAVVFDASLSFDMWTGWVALAILLLLALTSNDASVRGMGRAWKKLHRWVYAAAVLAFAHWVFIAFDYLPGLLSGMALIALQLVRAWKDRVRP